MSLVVLHEANLLGGRVRCNRAGLEGAREGREGRAPFGLGGGVVSPFFRGRGPRGGGRGTRRLLLPATLRCFESGGPLVC